MSNKFYRTLQDEKDNTDEMIFPLNIHESVSSSKGLKDNEKLTFGITIWVLLCGIISYFLFAFLVQAIPKYAIWIMVGVLIMLNATIGVYLLRYLMDERSIIKEYEANDGVSFVAYFKIYRDTQLTLNDKYSVIEFQNGTFAVFLRFRMGYNTNILAGNTWMYMRDAIRLIASSGFTCKMITRKEDFKSSDTCAFILNHLQKIEIPQLLNAQRDIIKGLIDEADKSSNVPSTHLIIYAESKIQKDDLLGLIHRLEKHFIVEQTCFRDIKFLDNTEILEFLRLYYELEVLDMSLLRAQAAASGIGYDDSFSVLKLYGESGKIYTTESMSAVTDKIMKDTKIRRISK